MSRYRLAVVSLMPSEDPMSEAILRGEFTDKNLVRVRASEGGLIFDTLVVPKEEAKGDSNGEPGEKEEVKASPSTD